ncbi:MAG: hypothetical protein RMN24_06815, partial [Anaerolineae bacterium]|nr:hypothetical protein [Anaerolineae bacterium]
MGAPSRRCPSCGGRTLQARPTTSPMGIDPSPPQASRGLVRKRLRRGAPHPPGAIFRPDVTVMPGVWGRHALRSGGAGVRPRQSHLLAPPLASALRRRGRRQRAAAKPEGLTPRRGSTRRVTVKSAAHRHAFRSVLGPTPPMGAPSRRCPSCGGRTLQAQLTTSPMGIDPSPPQASGDLVRKRLRRGAPHPPGATPRPGAKLMPGV